MTTISVSVNGQTGPNVTATSGDTIGVNVAASGSPVSLTVSPAGTPGGQGAAGPAGSVNLSDATPAALGTAAAGSSSTASRSDHVHAIPTIAYSALSGVPSTFTPASHTHTASQITDFATEAAKVGPVTSVNGQTGAVTVTASGTYTLPTASDTVLGGIKVGTGLSIASGVLSATGGSSYSLPTASSTTLGGVKIGSGLSITAGVLSATATGSSSGINANDTVDGGDYVGVLTATVTFTTQPTDKSLTITQGSTGSTTFTVSAVTTIGAAPIYQWQSNTAGTWVDIDGASSTTLSLTGLTAANTGTFYRCVVTAVGVVTGYSSVASLTVVEVAPSAPVITITTQPTSQTASSGAATFTVAATVTSGSVAYQWQKRESYATTWVNVSGATSDTLALTGLTTQADQSDFYRCRVSASGASTVYSSTATLNVPWTTVPQITIVSQPQSFNTYGGIVQVSVDRSIVGNTLPESYAWQALSGGNWVSARSVISMVYADSSNVLQFSANRTVTVRCVVTASNSYGSSVVVSNAATITVIVV